MKVEFFQDETGFIQFFNATEIWTRRDTNYQLTEEDIPKPVDIKAIMRWENEANKVEQLKNLQFEQLLNQVIKDLVVMRSNNQDCLFDIMHELNAKLKRLNTMSKQQIIDEIQETKKRQQYAKKQSILNVRQSTLQVDSLGKQGSKSVTHKSESEQNRISQLTSVVTAAAPAPGE